MALRLEPLVLPLTSPEALFPFLPIQKKSTISCRSRTYVLYLFSMRLNGEHALSEPAEPVALRAAAKGKFGGLMGFGPRAASPQSPHAIGVESALN